MPNSERPGGQNSRRFENAIVAANVTGTVTDAVAVAVDGTAVFVDETSNVGALCLASLQKTMMRVVEGGKIGLSLFVFSKTRKKKRDMHEPATIPSYLIDTIGNTITVVILGTSQHAIG